MTTRRRVASDTELGSGGSGMTKIPRSACSSIWTKADSEEARLLGRVGPPLSRPAAFGRSKCLVRGHPTLPSRRASPFSSLLSTGSGAAPAADGFGDSHPIRRLHVAPPSLVELFVPRQEIGPFFLEPAEEDVVDLAAQVEGDASEEVGA